MNDWEWMKQEALINKHKSAALAAWTWAQCYGEGNIRRQGPQSPKLSLSDWVNALYIITIQKRTSSEALWTADTLHVSLMTARERGNVHFVTSTKKCIFLLFIVLFSLSRSAIEAHKHTKLQKKNIRGAYYLSFLKRPHKFKVYVMSVAWMGQDGICLEVLYLVASF